MATKFFNQPSKLQIGDTVAVITLSSAGAWKFPKRFARGKKQIEESLGLKVIDTPNATKPSKWIKSHPKERLDDLLWALKNPDVKAIIVVTGGDDSIRLLDYFTNEAKKILQENPKIFLGFSDSTITHFMFLNSGIISFYGPSVLFGLAENGGIDSYTLYYLKKVLFSTETPLLLENNFEGWTLDRVPWESGLEHIKRKFQKPLLMKFIQGKGSVEGSLIGGCMDVLEFMKGTKLWPSLELWTDSILFLELSEEKPSPSQVKYWLRNYAAQGILKKINGIVFSIPGGDIPYDDPDYDEKVADHIASFSEYDQIFLRVCKEFDLEDLLIVTHVQIGHIAPMMTLPIGGKVRIDADKKQLILIQTGTQ